MLRSCSRSLLPLRSRHPHHRVAVMPHRLAELSTTTTSSSRPPPPHALATAPASKQRAARAERVEARRRAVARDLRTCVQLSRSASRLPQPDPLARQADPVLPPCSDTITVPSHEMLQIMQEGTLGDSVYEVRLPLRPRRAGRAADASARAAADLLVRRPQEDEDTRELEERVAQMAGKEAGLFCVSGTLVRPAPASLFLRRPRAES